MLNEDDKRKRMKGFRRILLISLILITTFSYGQKKLESNIIENVKKGDTLTFFSMYDEWGEWGGHVEKIYLTVKENDLWINYYKDKVFRLLLFKGKIIVRNKSKLLTPKDKTCIVKYLEDFKIASKEPQKADCNCMWLFEVISPDTTFTFHDWNRSWKGFREMQHGIFK